VNPEIAITNFIELWLTKMEGKYFEDNLIDTANRVLVVPFIRAQTDGYPAAKPMTQYNIGFGGLMKNKLKTNSQLFCRLLFHVPYGESHRATTAVNEYMSSELHALSVRSQEGKFRVSGFEVRVGCIILCTDWANSVKQLHCLSAASIFKGLMLQYHKHDFATLIGKSALDLKAKWIDFDTRERLWSERKTMEESCDNHESTMKSWEREHRNPQLGCPLKIGRYSLE